MIRTTPEYEDALQRLEQDRAVIAAQRDQMTKRGLTPAEVERALQASHAFHEQLMEEVEAYERLRRGDLAPIQNLAHIGRILIGLRIAQNISQRELAARLGVAESQVSRDERHEYHGVTVERAQRIIQALHGRVRVHAHIGEAEEEAFVPR